MEESLTGSAGAWLVQGRISQATRNIAPKSGASEIQRRNLLPWQSSGFGNRTAWGIVGRAGRTGKREGTKSSQGNRGSPKAKIFVVNVTIGYILRSRIYRRSNKREFSNKPIVNLVGYTECVTLERPGHLLNRAFYIGITI